MTRGTLRAILLLGTLGPLAGCSLYGLTSAMQGLGAVSGGRQPQSVVDRRWTVTGQIRLPKTLTDGIPLNAMPAIATGSQLLALAPLAGVSVYASQALAQRSVQATFASETVTAAQIEVIDAVTGQLAASASTDAQGHYVIQVVVPGSDRPYILQSLLRNGLRQVAGFLAAPLHADLAPTGRRSTSMDLSPGTTMLTFSSTLLSEAYPAFDPRVGFQGIKSARLATMIRAISPQDAQSAALFLDQSRTLSEGTTFDRLLSDTATASAILTAEVRRLARTAMATESVTAEFPGLNAAILGQVVERIGSLTAPPVASGSQSFLSAIADTVDLGSALGSGTSISQTLPSLPPLPTPTPAEGLTVTFN